MQTLGLKVWLLLDVDQCLTTEHTGPAPPTEIFVQLHDLVYVQFVPTDWRKRSKVIGYEHDVL